MNGTSATECGKPEPEVSLLQWHPIRRNRLGTPGELETLYVKKE
jgi:hypothetical protein